MKAINPGLVYTSISGHGDEGQEPVPFGLAVADTLAGAAFCRGILAGLLREGISGRGIHVQTIADGGAGRLPVRGADHSSE